MSYYDTFTLSQLPPSKEWKNAFQALVSEAFDNASSYYEDVEEEVEFGTLEFKPIKVRVTSLIDAKTGQRINDDFKKIIFSDLSYIAPIGLRYRFNDNIWIVYSSDKIKTDTASVYVRRCNNVMAIQDDYGNVHMEPVYIDYKVTENQIQKNHSIDIPSGRIQFSCQLNKYTKNIGINNRYVFGDSIYKVRQKSNFDRRNTFDKDSVNILSFYAELDNIGEHDNIELGIANYKKYNYQIHTLDTIQNVIGFKDKLSSEVYLNDSKVDEPIKWLSTDPEIATINSFGEYELINVGKCSFICSMVNNPNVTSTVNINVDEIKNDTFEDFISPNIDEIKLNQTIVYTIYEYDNGIQTDTPFDIQFSGNVNNENYKACIHSSNKFSITNMKTSNYPLVVVCTNSKRKDEDGNYVKTIFNIKLGGMF